MNKTYQYLIIILASKKYSYESLFSKLDLFLMLDRINEKEYIELSERLKAEENKVLEEVICDEESEG